MQIYDRADDNYPDAPPSPDDEPTGVLAWLCYGFTWLLAAAFVMAMVWRAVEEWWPFRGAWR